ncbi:hypothetical protein [Streptomyces sp. NBC_01281]|uniref:hypothetical protein n=1 Tax=Streptomyces sp. NBC_01281 TaxID=2903811 RepID=UPI003DA4B87D
MIRHWWQKRAMPGSQFALVHRLTTEESQYLITGTRYTCSSPNSDGTVSQEPVSGRWLRSLARQATLMRTVSVHLELPSGIVTLHSRREGDVSFHPAAEPASAPVHAPVLAPAATRRALCS